MYYRKGKTIYDQRTHKPFKKYQTWQEAWVACLLMNEQEEQTFRKKQDENKPKDP